MYPLPCKYMLHFHNNRKRDGGGGGDSYFIDDSILQMKKLTKQRG